jgi:phosphotransferase system  glucose/maltose/N-acetylglucosamine-specific IIC component
MDNKLKRQAARSQLATATILTFITVIKYLNRGHLNYISIAVGLIGLIIYFVAFRTLYLLRKQEQEAATAQKSNSEQLN